MIDPQNRLDTMVQKSMIIVFIGYPKSAKVSV
jgi:hypothetical protein